MQVTLSAVSKNWICSRDQHHVHLKTIFHKTKNTPKASGKFYPQWLVEGWSCMMDCPTSNLVVLVSWAPRQGCNCLQRSCCFWGLPRAHGAATALLMRMCTLPSLPACARWVLRQTWAFLACCPGTARLLSVWCGVMWWVPCLGEEGFPSRRDQQSQWHSLDFHFPVFLTCVSPRALKKVQTF